MSKSSKRRLCPAVGREIPSFDCGENRNTGYRCPADCGFNPLTLQNYDQLLDAEESVDKKTFERLVKGCSPGSATALKLLAAAQHPAPHALHGCVMDQMFLSPDAQGKTGAQRWEAEGFPGLKNDERVLFRAKMGIRVALLEVHRVIDSQQTEVVDLLEPNGKSLIIVDRSLARIGLRFATYLCWCYTLPYFSRMHGSAITIPDLAQFEPQEIVTEILRHLGGPTGGDDLRLWLAKNFLSFDAALTATSYARRADMFAGLDVEWGRTIYELRRSKEECCGVLEAIPQVAEDELTGSERAEGFLEARVWFAREGVLPVKVALSQEVLGRILMGATQWRLECIGQRRMELLRQEFENALGERVRFVSESRDDYAKKLAQKDPAFDAALVPPRLREQPEQLSLSSSRVVKADLGALSGPQAEAAWRRTQAEAFLDDTVPALDGRTPREAARDPALRPKLIRLIKQRVRGHDERNLELGRGDDINWLLRELGLTEILFAPPPVRQPVKRPEPVQPDDGGVDEGFDAAMEEAGVWDDLPLPPALPEAPFEIDEARRRLEIGVTEFDTAADALAALAAAGSTLINYVEAIVGKQAAKKDFTVILPYLIRIAFAFAPPGTLQPMINIERFAAGFEAVFTRATSLVAGDPQNELTALFEGSAQPPMTMIVGLEILTICTNGPKEFRLSPEGQLIAIVILRAVIDEMDLAMRELTSLEP